MHEKQPKVLKPGDSRTMTVTHITPPGRFDLNLRELWRDRELLGFLAMRTVRVRYKQALAGPLWAVFQPMLAMVVFSLVFGRLAGLPSDGLPYPVFYYSGLLLWTYFANSVALGANALVDNQQLVSKVYFPRAFLPLSGVLASLIDLAVGLVAFLPLLIVFGRTPPLTMVFLVIPVIVAATASAGLSLLLGALNARYRDVRFTVPFFLQAGLFASPIAYSLDLIPAEWRLLYALNPMTGAVQFFRWTLTGAGEVHAELLAVSAASAFGLLIVGYLYFQRVDGTIADVV